MKAIVKCGVVALFLTLCSDVFSQIDNRANLSPEWIRSAARNAAYDATDAAVFNPGGVTRLGNGIHFAVGNQSLFRKPSHEYNLGAGEVTRTQDGVDALFPNIYATYNRNNWAVTGGMFVSGGGATANYPEGSFATDMIGMLAVMGSMGAYGEAKDQYLEASSYYLTGMIGAAYQVNDKVSVGANARYLSAKNETKAGMTLTSSPADFPDAELVIDTEDAATGMGASFGIFVTPNDDWAISARYDIAVPLEFETTVHTDDIGVAEDGGKMDRDLPAVLATGVRYAINDKLTTEADFNYYFQSDADWGISSPATAERAVSDMAGDAFSYALSFEYMMNEKMLVSLGGMYTSFEWNDKDGYYTTLGAFETAPGNNVSVQTGLRYKIDEKITVNAGVARVMWEKDQIINALMLAPMDVDVTTNNSMTTLGIGLDFTF